MQLEELLPMLRCPRCGCSELALAEDAVKCSCCGSTYRAVKGCIPDLRVSTGRYGQGLWRVLYDLYSPLYDSPRAQVSCEDRVGLVLGYAENLPLGMSYSIGY